MAPTSLERSNRAWKRTTPVIRRLWRTTSADNVGDVAGMGADLFESYTGSIIATIALGVGGVAALGIAKPGEFDAKILVLPMLIATIGIFASIVGTFLVRTKDGASMGSLLWSLRYGIFGAGALVLAGTAAALWRWIWTSTCSGWYWQDSSRARL